MLLDVICENCFKKVMVAKTPYKPINYHDFRVSDVKHYCIECWNMIKNNGEKNEKIKVY